MTSSILRPVLACFVALAALIGCAETPHVGSDSDGSASFASYHRYILLPRDRTVLSFPADPLHNPLVVSRVEEEVKQGLERKGYVRVDDPQQADIVVDFTIGAQERLDVRSYPSGWGTFGDGPLWVGSRWGTDIDVRQYREGTLAIDVYDAHTRRPVWHGWAQKELTRKDIEQSAGPIHEAVESVLAKFPSALS